MTLIAGSALADLYIRDDVNDVGNEPYFSGMPWLSPDIFIRQTPLPGWNPYPFPSNSPPSWLTSVNPLHQDADFRSPLSGRPNYIYVRVRNRTNASTGTERLHLYWASASTGLSWDPNKVAGSFIDNLQGNVLFGAEVTKVRKNAATATQAERDKYIAALRQIATNPAFEFNNMSYWHLQQEIHRFGPSTRHGSGNNPFVPSVNFLPWHREFVNRYEGLLQEADPTVKLLYWNWESTAASHPLTGNFNFFTNNFMGASGNGQSSGVAVGPNLFPDLDPLYPTINQVPSGSNVLRRLEPVSNTNLNRESNATVIGRSDYDSNTVANDFSGQLEARSHNRAHPYISGLWNGTGGDMAYTTYASRDPFFFLLHAQVDRLWARWQRKNLTNLDPATTYGTATGDPNITNSYSPWNGTAFNDGLPNGNLVGYIDPWSPNGPQTVNKGGDDRSITSPPFYDDSQLVIPALQPGQEVVLEIPWYPPNPANFGGNDPNHVCLLARIEESNSAPWGMTVAETNSVGYNTEQNNNVAWKNIAVIDTVPGPFKIVRVRFANVFDTATVQAGLQLGGFTRAHGTVRVELGGELFERWRAGGGRGEGIKDLGDGRLELTDPKATIHGIELQPGDDFPVRFEFELEPDYPTTPPDQPLYFDVVQLGKPGDPNEVVGGERYEIDLEKLVPVKRGDFWRLQTITDRAPEGWTEVEFDDSRWTNRKLDLGLGGATCNCDAMPVVTLLRHTFDVRDPDFYRNLLLRLRNSDGVVAYLNGKEIYRANLPGGDLFPRTYALRPTSPVEGEVFHPIGLEKGALAPGRNTLAVELHRHEERRDQPTFDLELIANWERPRNLPAAVFTQPAAGSLARIERSQTVEIDALDPKGSIRQVELLVDGKKIGSLSSPPYRFELPVRAGAQRLNAVVTNGEGLATQVFSTFVGVPNIPPAISFDDPNGGHVEAPVGSPVTVTVNASDSDGSVQRVEFYVHDSIMFGVPGKHVGTATAPPYSVTLKDLKVGHNMIMAVAFDNEGARTGAVPLMVMVTDKDTAPSSHGHH